MNKQKILIFGGNKFLGKFVLKQLMNHFPEAEIISLTRSGLNEEYKNVRSVKCDRTAASSLKEALGNNEFDFVFDISAYKFDDLQASLDYLKNKVGSWCFVSSAGVYAKSKVFPLQANFPKIAVQPHLGKLQCEEALREVSGLHTFCIRPLYIYGEENTFDRETFLFRAIEDEKNILVPADGSALLQFAHVSEVARLLVELTIKDKKQTQHQAFHTADKNLYSLNSLIEICAEIIGKKAKINYFSQADCQKAGVQARDVFPLRGEHYFADTEPLHELGLKTEINLFDGLKKTYEWFKKNRELYPKHSINQAGEKILKLQS